MDPLETLTTRGQRSLELHNQINQIQITINVYRVVNT